MTKKTHGHIVQSKRRSPTNSGLLLPSSPRKPSGTVQAVPLQDATATAVPLPVSLNWPTILKFASVCVVSLVGIASTACWFFQKTEAHLADPNIHLERGERQTLETKVEARAARKDLVKRIDRDATIRQREMMSAQRQQIESMGDRLQRRQETEFRRLRRVITSN